MRRLLLAGLFLGVGAGACITQSGSRWVEGSPDGANGGPAPTDIEPLTAPGSATASPQDDAVLPAMAECDPDDATCTDDVVVLRDYGSGSGARGGSRKKQPDVLPADLFRNTYYDFPSEGSGAKDATLYDAACKSIAQVPRDFHDRVCVQGSGRLASGRTVSFAKRGCDCADICPRTGHKICFEALDPKKFPYGRGATGKAITPLYTIAVDSSVIPLGTPVFIGDFVGLPKPDGTKHDGCFLAADRGTRVIGRQVDIFTGDPSITTQWNKLVPSNQGVRVSLNDPRCPKPP